MARRKEQPRKRPDWGVPKGIVLFATPEGWCHSVLTPEGGMLCRRRLGLPANASSQDARDAAARMVTELARDFHDTGVEVIWNPPREPWSWTARVTPVAGNDPAPPDPEGHGAR
jgi:hypothetical protein